MASSSTIESEPAKCPSDKTPLNSAHDSLTFVLEIERKWLVRDLPDLSNYEFEEILQGYLPCENPGQEKRIRAHAGKYDLTIKGEGDLVRDETPPGPLTRQEFEALWPATEGNRIEKTRYKIPYQDNTIELDIYGGALAGLVVVEVEFKSVRDSEQFVAPAWFGKEVTEDRRFKNKNLASKGLPVENREQKPF